MPVYHYCNPSTIPGLAHVQCTPTVCACPFSLGTRFPCQSEVTACGVMFAARPCLPGTLFYTFVPGKLPIFSFIINKFIISNLFLHNPIHQVTPKFGFLDEMTCPANMGGRRTSLHKQYCVWHKIDHNFLICGPILIRQKGK